RFAINSRKNITISSTFWDFLWVSHGYSLSVNILAKNLRMINFMRIKNIYRIFDKLNLNENPMNRVYHFLLLIGLAIPSFAQQAPPQIPTGAKSAPTNINPNDCPCVF